MTQDHVFARFQDMSNVAIREARESRESFHATTVDSLMHAATGIEIAIDREAYSLPFYRIRAYLNDMQSNDWSARDQLEKIMIRCNQERHTMLRCESWKSNSTSSLVNAVRQVTFGATMQAWEDIYAWAEEALMKID